MGVIDFHVHVGKKDHLRPEFISYFEDHVSPRSMEFLDGITPASFVEYLDVNGVDRAVLLAEYSPRVTGVIPNEFVSGFCRGTDRLIPFGSIERESAEDPGLQTQRCIKELGCKGLKLYPPYSRFYPGEPWILPAYEAARDLGVPVMFHTGTSLFPGSRIRYANPLLIDEVADEFRDLCIIICHAGRPFWYKEAEWMLRRHKNVHIDISGIPPIQLPEIFPKMETLRDRFVFGSDWPNIPSLDQQLKQIRELPLSRSTIQALLWDNAARLLGIDSTSPSNK